MLVPVNPFSAWILKPNLWVTRIIWAPVTHNLVCPVRSVARCHHWLAEVGMLIQTRHSHAQCTLMDLGCWVSSQDQWWKNDESTKEWQCSRLQERTIVSTYMRSLDNWTVYIHTILFLPYLLLHVKNKKELRQIHIPFALDISEVCFCQMYIELTILLSPMSPHFAHLTSHITGDLDSVHGCCCPLLLAAVVHSCAVEWDGHTGQSGPSSAIR